MLLEGLDKYLLILKRRAKNINSFGPCLTCGTNRYNWSGLYVITWIDHYIWIPADSMTYSYLDEDGWNEFIHFSN